MKVYVDKNGLQEFATKLNNKQKTIFAAKSLESTVDSLMTAVGSPLVASTAAEMTDTNKIYVYVGSETGYTSGNWYYYDGSTWTSGGVYNSTAFETDETLTILGAAADAKATGDAIDEIKSTLTPIQNFNGIALANAGDTYQFMLRALKSDTVSFYDLLRFTKGKAITSDGTVTTLANNACTEDFYAFPRNFTIKSPSGVTMVVYLYDENKVKTGSPITVLQNKTVTIDVSDASYVRFTLTTEDYNTSDYVITISVDGLLFNEIDALVGKIKGGMILSSVGNQITNLYDGYMAKNGTTSTGNYYYTNPIKVTEGQSLSFWKVASGEVVNLQTRFLTAYDASGTAVTAKGGEYLTAYNVPNGIESVVVSFSNSVTDSMVVFGVDRPSAYVNTKSDLYVADEDFANGQNQAFYQKQRSNPELVSGMKYYLDEKKGICYCSPNNLTTAKINLYFNGNEATAGSSACFVDFASNTFGFYSAFGVYNAASLIVDESETVGMTFDVDHDYCIEYARHATSGYTLKITDMMTLEADETTTTNATNGWGIIGYDATDVTVSGFKRLTDLPENPTLLVIGDSYTEGVTVWANRDKRWCYLIGEDVGSFAINGQGGARSDHMESWIDKYLFKVFNPKYVIIETGTNEQATAYYTRNMTNIIAKVKAIGAVPILCTVPVTTATPNPSDYNTFVLNSGLPYIDICRALTTNGDRTTQNLDLFLTDKIHPNVEGHHKIYEIAKINVPEIFRKIV